jgi:hypothetical protein
MKLASCHPDQKHYAKGLCKVCYNHHREAGLIDTTPADCHPDRPAVARGMCRSCYNHDANVTHKTPERAAAKRLSKNAWVKTPNGRAATLLAVARTNALARGLAFNLDPSGVVIPSHCPVLGIPLDCAAGRFAPNLPSLDRIDNSKGYLKGNVWVISWRANRIKGNASIAELCALVHALESQTNVGLPRKVA